MIIGAHLSIAGGYPQACELSAKIKGSAFQFFTRNPRGGAQRTISDEEVEAGRQARRTHGVQAMFAHLPYTVNNASNKPQAYDFAKLVLREDLRVADRLGAEFAVVHPGSHVGDGVEIGIKRIIDAVSEALDGYSGESWLCLETMAGQGSEIGSTPEELKAIIEGVGNPERLGICLDSCHLFAAGFDVRTRDGLERMLDTFDRVVGLDRIKCLHLNDSKADCGSHKDRHELIGRGMIGAEGIINILTHPFMARLPVCLETPVDDMMQYADEIEAVHRLLGG